jgi:hypothetical protein
MRRSDDMAKKNPFVFTIGFNPKNPDHVLVAERLNAQGKGNIATFLVKAVLAYDGNSHNDTMNPTFLENMIQKIVTEQFALHTNKQLGSLSYSKETPLDNLAQKNILHGLAGFRKSK